MDYLKKVIYKFKVFNLQKQKHNIISQIKSFDLEKLIKSKKVIFVFLLLGVSALYFDFHKSEKNIMDPSPQPTQVDTFIPEGFVLIPIEIQNFEALDALLGSFALVDIFSTHNHNKSKKLLENVKLIRAPLNPKQFAVLVSESRASNIMQEEGPYFVMIQNPNATKPNSVEKKLIKTKIIYEDKT